MKDQLLDNLIDNSTYEVLNYPNVRLANRRILIVLENTLLIGELKEDQLDVLPPISSIYKEKYFRIENVRSVITCYINKERSFFSVDGKEYALNAPDDIDKIVDCLHTGFKNVSFEKGGLELKKAAAQPLTALIFVLILVVFGLISDSSTGSFRGMGSFFNFVAGIPDYWLLIGGLPLMLIAALGVKRKLDYHRSTQVVYLSIQQ